MPGQYFKIIYRSFISFIILFCFASSISVYCLKKKKKISISYYKTFNQNKYGDYTFSQKIEKSETKDVSFYQVKYLGKQVLSEKLFEYSNGVHHPTYSATYDHNPKKKNATKYEILKKDDGLYIRIKVLGRNLGYSSISLYNASKKLLYTKKYYSNGRIKSINYYNSKNKPIKEEIYNTYGIIKDINHFYHYKKKKLLIKKLTFNNGNYSGYFTYKYDTEGNQVEKIFHDIN